MLSVQGINAFYGQSHVLHDIRLDLDVPGSLAVLGRNGAGKSTLLKSIMGAGPITRGTISLNGSALGSKRAHERAQLGLALVPEDRRIFSHLTTIENLAIAQYASNRRDLPSLDEVIGRFPMLATLRDRLGTKMSGGQQQMLAIARAIAAKPRILLLDEPTEGLAPVIVESLADEIVACCDAFGISLLLAEQNVWFARRCTSRVCLLDTGSLVFQGTWDEFDAVPDLVQKYLAI